MLADRPINIRIAPSHIFVAHTNLPVGVPLAKRSRPHASRMACRAPGTCNFRPSIPVFGILRHPQQRDARVHQCARAVAPNRTS